MLSVIRINMKLYVMSPIFNYFFCSDKEVQTSKKLGEKGDKKEKEMDQDLFADIIIQELRSNNNNCHNQQNLIYI